MWRNAGSTGVQWKTECTFHYLPGFGVATHPTITSNVVHGHNTRLQGSNKRRFFEIILATKKWSENGEAVLDLKRVRATVVASMNVQHTVLFHCYLLLAISSPCIQPQHTGRFDQELWSSIRRRPAWSKRRSEEDLVWQTQTLARSVEGLARVSN